MILYLMFFLVVVNFILSIAIAGSLVRVVRYLSERNGLPRMSRRQRYVEVENRTPTYADIAFQGTPPNWDGVSPRPINWSGLPKIDD